MFEIKNTPEIVGVISGLSTTQSNIKDRPSHGFSYKIDGESVFDLRKKEIHQTPGSLLYIPEHENYSRRKITPGDSRYSLINFHAEFAEPAEPRLFLLPPGENIVQLFKQIERCRRFEGDAGGYESLSLFYHLLAILARSEQIDYTSREQKEQIAPAIEYLESYMFDSDLRISRMPDLCNMSAPTFRHIFISRFGVSPKKYVIHQRMQQAKMILESGEYESIADVAMQVGYEDPLYFSRHFKSIYGKAPSGF